MTLPSTPPADPDAETLWVQSDRTPDGYVATVVWGPDRAWPLPGPVAAWRYAQRVTTVAMTAQHDAAVGRQLRDGMGADLTVAAALIAALRARRDLRGHPVPVLPGLDMHAIVNEQLEPIVGMQAGELRGQAPAADILEHGVAAIAAAAAAELDQLYASVLVAEFSLSPDRAAAAVGDLVRYWPGGAPGTRTPA